MQTRLVRSALSAQQESACPLRLAIFEIACHYSLQRVLLQNGLVGAKFDKCYLNEITFGWRDVVGKHMQSSVYFLPFVLGEQLKMNEVVGVCFSLAGIDLS